MTAPTMVQVDVQRLYEDLRALLQERFRSVFLNRRRRGHSTRASEAIEAATKHFLFELPETRREIQKIVSKHTNEDQAARPHIRTVYAPELLKRLAHDIGREAWSRRYDGRVQIELKIQSSRVTLHQIQPPDASICTPP
ncbi:hypothetical protein GGP78_003181 [Salinibacter ruber]|uniref:hypothetical protein n=1 Tax=Salinibacter ruber TaxID=146919 RepID=UPI002167A1A9|nr:hypothetical protein [Salinibacter ruber]MCS3856478.1 hypothetical protein [Salinibacter ruber]